MHIARRVANRALTRAFQRPGVRHQCALQRECVALLVAARVRPRRQALQAATARLIIRQSSVSPRFSTQASRLEEAQECLRPMHPLPQAEIRLGALHPPSSRAGEGGSVQGHRGGSALRPRLLRFGEVLTPLDSVVHVGVRPPTSAALRAAV
jgi:hypothetical protein